MIKAETELLDAKSELKATKMPTNYREERSRSKNVPSAPTFAEPNGLDDSHLSSDTNEEVSNCEKIQYAELAHPNRSNRGANSQQKYALMDRLITELDTHCRK